MNNEYGTIEYYSEMFSDILADVDASSAKQSIDNIHKGYLMAIDSWLEYHTEQVNAYNEIRKRVHSS